MKKIKKSLNYLLKISMVCGLLFTDLSGLSIVFADELDNNKTDKVIENNLDTIKKQDKNVNLNKKVDTSGKNEINNKKIENNFEVSIDNNKILLIYKGQEELVDTDKYKINIFEDCTNNSFTELDKVESIELTGLDLKNKAGYEITSKIIDKIKFSGKYSIKIEVIKLGKVETDNLVLSTINLEEDILVEAGLSIKVIENSKEIKPNTSGVYEINDDITVTYHILGGGLSKDEIYTFKEETLSGEELVNREFKIEKIFSDKLYGEYSDNILIKNSLDERVIDENITYLYKKYMDNAEYLNSLIDKSNYEFKALNKDGNLFIKFKNNAKFTVGDIEKILSKAYPDNIKYTIKNSQDEDILKTYHSLPAEEQTGYLDNIMLTNDTVIVLTNKDESLEVNFKCVILGDMNLDGLLNTTDLDILMNQVLETDSITPSGDINMDGVVNELDILDLDYVIRNNNWNFDNRILNGDFKLGLVVNKESITSGDTFTVDYIVSAKSNHINGIAGNVLYDNTILEIVDVKMNQTWTGNFKNEKFVYYGDSELFSKNYVESEIDPNNPEQEPIKTLDFENFKVMTITFKALKSGKSVLEIEAPKAYLGTNLYKYDEAVSTSVEVTPSTGNTLSSIKIAGKDIDLIENVYEYEMEVPNEVTDPNVVFTENNINANVISSIPQELNEGINEIKITITSESGEELVYIFKVNRKAAPKVEETPVTNITYTENESNDVNSNEDAVTPDEDIEEDDETPENEYSDKKDDLSEGRTSRIIIIILILLVIAGLIYLIFKDDVEENESKKVNKDIDKLKKTKDFTEPTKETPTKKEPKTKQSETKETGKVNKSSSKKNNKK